MRSLRRVVPLATICMLASVTGCASATNDVASPPTTTPPLTPALTQPADATGTAQPPQPTKTAAPPAPTSTWPTPEDCISYDPNKVTVHYEAGVYAISDGTKSVMKLPGGPGDTEVGQKGLALAQRYRKHCFLGRDNAREEFNSYIFDYWRDVSGKTPTIPGQEDDCSQYNRKNLTVEDMGGGDGWRVKDHDHVLHLFDNGTDAKNGKLVLAKYNQICFIGNSGDDLHGQDLVDYLI